MEASVSIDAAKQVLLSFGIILAFGAVCGLIAQKIKVPDVVIFLLVGILMGPEVSGLINIKADSALNQLILIFGSCYILFDGGASLKLKVLKEVWITIVVIATVGILIMTAVTGVAAYYILNVPFIIALLLGSTIASTDPATLVPIFRQVRIRERVSQTVMSESAFNDVMGAIVTFAILAVASGKSEFSVATALFNLVKESGLGILAGGILGYLAALLIAHEKYNFLSEYAPVVSLMTVIGAYLGADNLHASGFMAVFIFGIVLGNKEAFGFAMEKGEEEKLEEYVLTTAFIMRMFIFILLGSQVDFGLMRQYMGSGFLIIMIFMFLARPLTVFICAGADRRARWSMQELIFMCWTRETGVIPAALAGLLVGMKAPGAQMIASVTFIAILMTILIQATTTKWLARRLGLLIEE
ncbi:MAG: pesticidal protein Cry5Ba [Thermodesulfovibrio sp.]|nr:pesticidal protein Cry5Ba [Thermodesulfovibrio sp.]